MQPADDVGLKEADPELYAIIVKEKKRQVESLELIASENFVTYAIQECLGSCLTNKYAEGYPGNRYYGGTEWVDQMERLCISRALEAFKISGDKWHVNVQPLSGSPANLAVYLGLINPHDRIMGMGVFEGGHLTHGAYTTSRKLSASAIFYESLNYGLDEQTACVDYDAIRAQALKFRPKLLICGYSAYPRLLDYSKFRSIADEAGCLLWCDMAHISGLVATGCLESPFAYCDVVTTTIHKTLRGPRSGIIFVNKDTIPGGAEKIDMAVFPGMQGGPHLNNIGAVAHQLKQAMTPEFKVYTQLVLANCQALAAALMARGMKLETDGTDNHLLLVNLRQFDITGSKLQLVCDAVNISLNKNPLAGDSSAASPSGVRLGSAALTTRGFTEKDFEMVADLFCETIPIAMDIQRSVGRKLVDFRVAVEAHPKISDLRGRVVAMATRFPMPGRVDL